MNEILTALIPVTGIFGVVTGAVLNEFLRRRNRRELYAPKIFAKRLLAHEGLVEKIHEFSHLTNEIINNSEFTPEQRHELISVVVHDMVDFTEKNHLYLDEELSLHCIAMYMGVEKIHDACENDKKEMLENYNEMRKESLRMAAEESGVTEINRLFKSINRPKIGGPFISSFREAKRKAERVPK